MFYRLEDNVDEYIHVIEIKIPIKKHIRIDPRNLKVRFKEIHNFWNCRINDNQQI